MDMQEAMLARHSVRQFKEDPIEGEVKEKLEAVIAECAEQSGLRMQLILDDPECFDTLLGRYGKFKNAVNYVAIVGKKDDDMADEHCGYYGERIVMEAQMLGLGTCWVGGSYGKGKCKIDKDAGEKIICVIAIGYGENEGKPHKSRPVSKVCDIEPNAMPVWFRNGVRAALLAPTALNQQKFRITLEGGEAVITTRRGPFTKVDLGIVKHDFEAASGHKCR